MKSLPVSDEMYLKMKRIQANLIEENQGKYVELASIVTDILERGLGESKNDRLK